MGPVLEKFLPVKKGNENRTIFACHPLLLVLFLVNLKNKKNVKAKSSSLFFIYHWKDCVFYLFFHQSSILMNKNIFFFKKIRRVK